MALTKDKIKLIVNQFTTAAKRVASIGFDMADLHAPNGYLVHQFLLPVTNKRTNEYGVSTEKRMRFGFEVIDAMQASVPKNFPICIRISMVDCIDGGLQHMGTLGSGYQLPFADAFKKTVNIPVIEVGLITEPLQSQKAIEVSQTDIIAIGRRMLYDPR